MVPTAFFGRNSLPQVACVGFEFMLCWFRCLPCAANTTFLLNGLLLSLYLDFGALWAIPRHCITDLCTCPCRAFSRLLQLSFFALLVNAVKCLALAVINRRGLIYSLPKTFGGRGDLVFYWLLINASFSLVTTVWARNASQGT
jgi:hypothetical protein